MSSNASRTASRTRTTKETDVSLQIDLDGTGQREIETGVGFFDHMLDQLSKHSLIDLRLKAKGDLHIDDHHTVEDVGIALGEALKEALGDKAGINRYGHAYVAMDEALSRVALDLSNRPFLVWNVQFTSPKIGTFDTELVREFFQAIASAGGITLHADSLAGENAHHIAESLFKALARALRVAVEADPRSAGQLPSTKGTL